MNNNSIFDLILSLAEAAEMWGFDDSKLRKDIIKGKLQDGIEVKKYGKQWVITKEAMYKHYGEPKAE